ncbi:hypothetical protein V5O48_014912 [Marasmius crinis-equi]|uniref:Uncharacterized protein n=1 Tax=Marasmius crinis-equi TaxID=585013 RepID=A0ABR3EW00_9AGAR
MPPRTTSHDQRFRPYNLRTKPRVNYYDTPPPELSGPPSRKRNVRRSRLSADRHAQTAPNQTDADQPSQELLSAGDLKDLKAKCGLDSDAESVLSSIPEDDEDVSEPPSTSPTLWRKVEDSVKDFDHLHLFWKTFAKSKFLSINEAVLRFIESSSEDVSFQVIWESPMRDVQSSDVPYSSFGECILFSVNHLNLVADTHLKMAKRLGEISNAIYTFSTRPDKDDTLGLSPGSSHGPVGNVADSRIGVSLEDMITCLAYAIQCLERFTRGVEDSLQKLDIDRLKDIDKKTVENALKRVLALRQTVKENEDEQEFVAGILTLTSQ